MKNISAKKAAIAHLKRETVAIKSELMKIHGELMLLCPKEADKLGTIIGRLENWHSR